MKQLLTRTLTTILLALAIAPSLNAYPMCFAKLKQDGVTMALVGDEHTAWTPSVTVEPPYIQTLFAWFEKLKNKKTATHVIMEFPTSKEEQEPILADFVENKQAKDCLNAVAGFAAARDFTHNTIKFHAADQRIGAIAAVVGVFDHIRINNGFKELEILLDMYGQVTFGDFFKQVTDLYDTNLKKLKALKLSSKATAEIAAITEQYERVSTELRTRFNKLLPHKVVFILNELLRSNAMQPAQLTYLYESGIVPMLGAVGDLAFAVTLIEAAQQHKDIVAYLGGHHVARAIVILEGAGFEIVEKLGTTKYSNEPCKPLDLDVFKKALANSFSDATTSEESKESKTDAAAKEEGKKAITCNNPGCTTTTGPKQLVCSVCKEGKYCSATCQRAHWPTHKPSCKKAAQTETQTSAGSAGAAGAGASATAAERCSNSACAADVTGKTFLVCGNCKKTKYCSRACKKSCWPTHETTCKKA